MKQDQPNESGVKFNIGSSQLMLISSLLSKATSNYLTNNNGQWYHTMRGVKQQIIPRLTAVERQELTDMEIKLNCKVNELNKAQLESITGTKRWSVLNNQLAELVIPYDTRIREMLEQKGYLVPTQEDSTDVFQQEG